ncbi:hypothetical protein QVD17_03730 [Tagetes erecta]|uniref:Uncharacterized protein n=1 Tax=Tagetes erecta TaxID=13708 RepID=A0AAD8L8V2_TARER|nr:hypothetical protein QVD17_03730 [Tagetes erecta]
MNVYHMDRKLYIDGVIFFIIRVRIVVIKRLKRELYVHVEENIFCLRYFIELDIGLNKHFVSSFCYLLFGSIDSRRYILL